MPITKERVSKSLKEIFGKDWDKIKDHYKRYYAEGKWTASGVYRVGLKTIKYLIDKGYDIPIYDKK